MFEILKEFLIQEIIILNSWKLSIYYSKSKQLQNKLILI